MENYKVWHVVFAVFSGLTYWIVMSIAIYTPAWSIVKIDMSEFYSAINNLVSNIGLGNNEDIDSNNPFGLFKNSNRKVGDKDFVTSPNNTIAAFVFKKLVDYQRESQSESGQRYGEYGMSGEMETRFGIINNIQFCVDGNCEYMNVDDDDSPDTATFLILILGQIMLFIAWVWSLSIFCCRCCRLLVQQLRIFIREFFNPYPRCMKTFSLHRLVVVYSGPRFYWALPVFCGLSMLAAVIAVIIYATKIGDYLDVYCYLTTGAGGIFAYTGISVPDCEQKLGYSFIVAIVGAVIMAILVAIGFYVACTARPANLVTHVHPYTGPNSYENQNMNQSYANYNGAQGEAYPASYYRKPNANAQPVQYPM